MSHNGRLRVCGTHLCNESGDPIQLRGMSSKGLKECGRCMNESSLDALAHGWGADIVRLPIRPKYYITDPAHWQAEMDAMVNASLERGMYCIIDWHGYGYALANDYVQSAKSFFDAMSKKHGHKGHVLYEILNEPTDAGWSVIKAYAEQIIPIIRKNDPEGIIIVGTPDWDSRPQDVLQSPGPLTGSNAYNVMYTVHFYAATNGEADRNLRLGDEVTDQLPIFVTEWGTPENSGTGPNDLSSSKAWVDLMRAKKISWCNWSYCDEEASSHVFESGTCPAGPWVGASLKESGIWLSDWIQDPPDDFGSSSGPVMYQCSDGTDNDGDGLTDYPNDPGCATATDNDEYDESMPPILPPGAIEAESGSLILPMQGVSSLEASGGAYVQTTTENAGTATYTIHIGTPGSYIIIARVYAADNGGTYYSDSFFVRIDDQEEFIWDLHPAGAPSAYNVWAEDEVSKRGTGTYDNPQFDPYMAELSEGSHTIAFRGRERETRLDYFYLVMVKEAPKPNPPSNLRAVE